MTSKLSAHFRRKLASLDDGDTVCAVVLIAHSQEPVQKRLRGVDREARSLAIDVEFRKLYDQLEPIITAEGGKVLGTQKEIYTITVEAQRPLIEHLSRIDSVQAIMENQTIGVLHTH